MWFVFPQLVGLGHSAMARRYAIRDLDHAKRYLADPLLGSRLCHDVRLMMRHKGKCIGHPWCGLAPISWRGEVLGLGYLI